MNKHYPHLADKLPAPSEKVGNIRSLILRWWAREDSNLQPSDYHPLALNIEQRATCGDFVASECPRWWSYVYDRFEELLPKL